MSQFAKKIFLVSLIFCLFLVGCSSEQKNTTSVSNAFAFAPLDGQSISAAYFTLHNKGENAITLTRVEIENVQRTEIHNMEMHDDIMQMRQVDQMTVLGNGELVLRQGGKHLMLFGVEDFSAGMSRKMTLFFDDGTQANFDLQIKKR